LLLVVDFFIAVAKLGPKWSLILLEYEFLQSLTLAHFADASHTEKVGLLSLFVAIGSHCPHEICECTFVGEVLTEAIDLLQSANIEADFVIAFLTMMLQVINIRECPQDFDRAALRFALEELSLMSDNESIRALGESLGRAIGLC
jgi:hypothetical protein